MSQRQCLQNCFKMFREIISMFFKFQSGNSRWFNKTFLLLCKQTVIWILFKRFNSVRALSDLCYIFSNGARKMNRRIFHLESGVGFVCVRATTCKPPAPPPQPLFTVQSFYIFIEPDWLFCQPEIGIMTTETIHDVHTLYKFIPSSPYTVNKFKWKLIDTVQLYIVRKKI
jgi:hypothetical protein